MKALVTGGAGFVGSHVVKTLLAKGIETRVLQLPKEDTRNLKGLEYEPIVGDLTDPSCLEKAVKGCDWVFHVAAIYALWLPKPERMRQVNVEGTRNILRAAEKAGVKKVVHTSTIAAFSGQGVNQDVTEKSPFSLQHTGDLYCITKYEAHKVAEEFAARGLDVSIAAPCGPIGPGDVAPTPTGRFFLATVNMPITFMIDMQANLVDVRDVAAGHILAAEKGRRGESYLLGNGNYAYREIADLVMRITGVRKTVVTLPNSAAAAAARVALFLADHVTHRPPLLTPATVAIRRYGLRADCTKAFTELGLPRTPLETSVRDALIWFARNGYIKNEKVLRNLPRS
ncbi:MAG: SDR family oxidoreductase [Nitrospirae bacterium]|nr:SDR family oxidoreductase [Nitrospirota bacterium]